MTSDPSEKPLWPTPRQVLAVVGLFAAVALLFIAAPRPPSPEPPASTLRLPWVASLGVALGAIRRARSRGESHATQVLYAGSMYLGTVFLGLALVAIAWSSGVEPGTSIYDDIGLFLFPDSAYPTDDVFRLIGIAFAVATFVGGGFVLLRHLVRQIFHPYD